MPAPHYAIVCSSNNNRSMEGHRVLRDMGCTVSSYGTGNAVRLPGPSVDRPNVYPFGTAYERMYNELKKQDEKLYSANGILAMLSRNKGIKLAPEKFQSSKENFDIIISCEERCYDAIIEDLIIRGSPKKIPVHVINIDIKDNHEEALIAGQQMNFLVKMLNSSTNLDEEIDGILDEFRSQITNNVLHTVCFY